MPPPPTFRAQKQSHQEEIVLRFLGHRIRQQSQMDTRRTKIISLIEPQTHTHTHAYKTEKAID